MARIFTDLRLVSCIWLLYGWSLSSFSKKTAMFVTISLEREISGVGRDLTPDYFLVWAKELVFPEFL